MPSQTNFYITESGALYRRTLYFLQSDWLAICQPLLDNMAGTHFRKMEQDEAARVLGKPGRKLAFSHVRLLPKEQGVRPIVNLSHKPVRGKESRIQRQELTFSLHCSGGRLRQCRDNRSPMQPALTAYSVCQRYSRSINQILSDAFAILGYERVGNPPGRMI